MQKVDQILEAQARLEIKVDSLMKIAMQVLSSAGVEFDLNMEAGYTCPLCNMPAQFQTKVETGGVERVCACGTGCLPTTNLVELQKQLGITEKKKEKNDGQHGEGSAETEERLEELETRDPDSRR